MRALSHLTTTSLALLVLAGCTTIPPENRSENDPWESMNRTIFDANMVIDRVTTKPLARGYEYITPGPVRTGVGNFFRNLTTPRSSVNNFLQGKPRQGFSEFGRFLLNSTVGIGGLLDVATHAGMDEYREDFGQTAAVWGMPDGPYVMLPFLGPKTLRDLAFFPLDMAAESVAPLRQHISARQVGGAAHHQPSRTTFECRQDS